METPGDPIPPRIPEYGDLVNLCRELNARGARYVVIGGLAMAQQGFLRATEDVDLLIERSRENEADDRALRHSSGCAVRRRNTEDGIGTKSTLGRTPKMKAGVVIENPLEKNDHRL